MALPKPVKPAKLAKPPMAAMIYQLKVTLRDIRPPIWRRLQVPGDTTVSSLHDVLQVAMGWTDAHLHQFIAAGRFSGQPDPEYVDDLEVKNEQRTKLSRLARRAKTTFLYQYDFGDNWEHVLLVEKLVPPEPGVAYPRCLAGKRACPPEDCGGPWGYAELLAALRDPHHPDHRELREWVGRRFAPEAFDLEAVNRTLQRLRER